METAVYPDGLLALTSAEQGEQASYRKNGDGTLSGCRLRSNTGGRATEHVGLIPAGA